MLQPYFLPVFRGRENSLICLFSFRFVRLSISHHYDLVCLQAVALRQRFPRGPNSQKRSMLSSLVQTDFNIDLNVRQAELLQLAQVHALVRWTLICIRSGPAAGERIGSEGD
jgi:hypothetical protein